MACREVVLKFDAGGGADRAVIEDAVAAVCCKDGAATEDAAAPNVVFTV